VDDAVDEQGWRAQHLARGQAAVHIPADPLRHRGASPVAVERRHVEAELVGIPQQVAVLERLLPVEQQLVHVPEPVLQSTGLGHGRCGEGVRVDAGQRKVPVHDPHVPAELLFDLLDRVEGHVSLEQLRHAVAGTDILWVQNLFHLASCTCPPARGSSQPAAWPPTARARTLSST